MASDSTQKSTIVFVHGLWMYAGAWQPWMAFFREHGYEAVAASWPGESPTAEETRRNAAAMAGYGIAEITGHTSGQIDALGHKPIVIGHSLGGLVAQKLLGGDRVSAAIAIAPAPAKGVWELPLSSLRSVLPAARNPLNLGRAVTLTEREFRFAFTNALSDGEAKELYTKHVVPAPARPVFQLATAALTPNAASTVNFANTTRGPLLLIAGEKDHSIPAVMVKSTLKRHRQSPAVTDYREFANRGHSLTVDSGWREVAEYCLTWLQSKGL